MPKLALEPCRLSSRDMCGAIVFQRTPPRVLHFSFVTACEKTTRTLVRARSQGLSRLYLLARVFLAMGGGRGVITDSMTHPPPPPRVIWNNWALSFRCLLRCRLLTEACAVAARPAGRMAYTSISCSSILLHECSCYQMYPLRFLPGSSCCHVDP